LLANAGSNVSPVREVLSLLNEIRSAWSAIGPQVRSQGSVHPSQTSAQAPA
jgi:flagellin-specific chaperone FliS